MAGTTGTKCPVCGKSVGVGLVSGTLIQHENKHGERCSGTGMAPVLSVPRGSAGSGSISASKTSSASAAANKPSSGSSISGAQAGGGARKAPAAPRAAAPSRRGVTVRKVEVDQDWLQAREEKQERLRLEREARARARNEIYSTGIGEEEADAAAGDPDAVAVDPDAVAVEEEDFAAEAPVDETGAAEHPEPVEESPAQS